MKTGTQKTVSRGALGLIALCVLGATGFALARWVERDAEVRARNRLLAQRTAASRPRLEMSAVPAVPARLAEGGAASAEIGDARSSLAPRTYAPPPPASRRATMPAMRPQSKAAAALDMRSASAVPRAALPSVPSPTAESLPPVPYAGVPAVEFNRIALSQDLAPFLSPAEESIPESGDEAVASDVPESAAPSPQSAGYAALPGGQEPEPAKSPAPTPGGATLTDPPPATSAGSGAPSRSSPPGSIPRIALLPSSAAAEVGQTLRVAVLIEGGYDISSVPFHLQHDGKVLQFQRAYAGDFLSRDGSAPVVMAAPLEGSNEVVVGITKTGTGQGISGSGTLLTLEFRVVGAGTTALQFTQQQVLNSQRREVPAQFVPSQVSGR